MHNMTSSLWATDGTADLILVIYDEIGDLTVSAADIAIMRSVDLVSSWLRRLF